MLEKLNWFCLTSLIRLALLMWTWMGLFLRKSYPFKMLRLTCCSKLDWGCYIVSIAKTASKKMKPWSILWSFFLLRLLCISTNLPYIHAWNTIVTSWMVPHGAPFNPSLATSLEPLAHCRNVASLSFFYGFYFGRCSSELAQLVLLPFSQLRSTCYSDGLHDFSVTIPRCYNDVYVNIFFFSHS